MSVTRAIMRRLVETGGRHIFGIPGGECNLDLIAEADEAGLRFVLNRTETAAAIMASVAGELTDTPGLIMTTRGPGIASAVNGVAYAALDRTPLLVMADGYEDDQGFISHQRIDQAAMLRPMLKGESRLASADPLAELDALLDCATAQPPGAVYVELTGSRIRAAAPPTARADGAAPASLDRDTVGRARAMIGAAKRPLILAGLQARTDAASAALHEAVTRLGCPVLTTYKAKGAFPDADPRTLGHYIGGVAEEAAIRAADLLILYGFDPVEGPPSPWKYGDIPMLELTEHRFEHPLFEASLSVIGPVAEALPAVLDGVEASGWPTAELARFKQGIATAARIPVGHGIAPQEVVDAAAAALPATTRIAVDAGAHMLPVLHIWQSAEPRQSLISRGLSTMGFALPAAIASSLIDPDRPVVAFTGDGGLMMCLGELGTAIQFGATPIVVVFNDSALTLIGAKQRRRQLAASGLDFSATDFAQVARGFGWRGYRVSTREELAEAFAQAATRREATLIDVEIDPDGYHAQIRALRG